MLRQMLLVTVVMFLAIGQSGLAQQPTSPMVNLNPDPNLLQSPTRSQTVKIRYQVPITLQEALDLAKRNNPQLRSTEFQVQRSQAQVQEIQAENLPRFRIQGNVNQR